LLMPASFKVGFSATRFRPCLPPCPGRSLEQAVEDQRQRPTWKVDRELWRWTMRESGRPAGVATAAFAQRRFSKFLDRDVWNFCLDGSPLIDAGCACEKPGYQYQESESAGL
jgi:hypothetical protein